MLNALVRFSVRRREVIIALAAAALVYGLVVVRNAKYDVFPEFAPPQVTIQTEAPGLTAKQVEMLVTTPIEDAINGMNGIATVRSQSIQGLSAVTVVLTQGAAIYRARQQVAERLGQVARQLPAAAHAPIITPLTSSSNTVLVLGLTSTTRSLRDERTFVDWTMKPRLLAVPGVAKVAIYGGQLRQFQIQLDPAKLRAYGLGIDQVVAAARRATGVRGGGVIDNANQRIVVRTEGQLATPALLAQSVVREEGGAVIRLGDLGRVVPGTAPMFGDATIDGKRGVVLILSGQLGANTLDVTKAAERALADLRPAIAAEGYTLYPALFRPANFIDLALSNITRSLLLGGILVAVVLLLFLFDVGAAAVSLVAIPLSLLSAIVVLDHFGLSINTLTLGGLAIAIGEVVDDAIIDVENITRRLRENRGLAHPRPAPQVVVDASLEVRSSVVYASFIVALVFLPVVALSGVQGALFRPLALAYILAILASLVVALTVTPALTLTLLGRRRGRTGDPAPLVRLKRGYVRALERLEQSPKLIMAATALLMVIAAAMIPFFGTTFLPEFREGHLILHLTAVPGTSLAETVRMGDRVTALLLKDPRVRSVAQKVGRAELGEETRGTNGSEFEVDLNPLTGRELATVGSELRSRLAGFPGATFAIRPFLTERIQEILTGTTAPVVVKVFGANLDSIDVAARRLAAVVRATPGAIDVQYDPPPITPEVTVRVRPTVAAQVGVPAVEVLDAVRTATTGTRVGEVFQGNRATDVVVKLDPRQLARPEDLGNIPLTGVGGRIVTVSQVADAQRTTGRYLISHEGARRFERVMCDVSGTDPGTFTTRLARRLRGVPLPRGVYTEIGGTAAAQRTAQHELLLRSLFAAGGILLLLWMAFGDIHRLLLVLANLPFALVGGIFAAFATGALLSLGSLVGFVTLFGITTRNSIMLISHYDHLVTQEGMTWGPAAAVRGAAERLGPILMTALVTGLGLLPLALGSGAPGREIEGPLAIVILGGLVTSTLLSLFVLPTLALAFGRFGNDATASPRDGSDRTISPTS